MIITGRLFIRSRIFCCFQSPRLSFISSTYIPSSNPNESCLYLDYLLSLLPTVKKGWHNGDDDDDHNVNDFDNDDGNDNNNGMAMGSDDAEDFR